MSHIRKAVNTEARAYAAYRSACADLVVYRLTARTDDDPELTRLERRAHAHRVQWEAADRRLSTIERRDTERRMRAPRGRREVTA